MYSQFYMNSYGKTLSMITIIALITAVFFVFGVHELKNHLCPISVTTGICGFLGGLANAINHIFSLNMFFVLILPALVSFLVVFVAYSLVLPAIINRLPFARFSEFLQPAVKIRELRWLSFHINSPTL